MIYRTVRPLAAAALAVALAVSASAASQDSKSAPLAKELAQLLDAAKIDSIAAPDPTTGGYVAALYIPGTQLLVVSGKLTSTVGAEERIKQKQFRDLYMDLQGAAIAGSRFFASDVAADGLAFKANGDLATDSCDFADKSVSFMGHKKAKMSEEDYTKAYSEADQQYARILSLLLAQAKPKTGS